MPPRRRYRALSAGRQSGQWPLPSHLGHGKRCAGVEPATKPRPLHDGHCRVPPHVLHSLAMPRSMTRLDAAAITETRITLAWGNCGQPYSHTGANTQNSPGLVDGQRRASRQGLVAARRRESVSTEGRCFRATPFLLRCSGGWTVAPEIYKQNHRDHCYKNG